MNQPAASNPSNQTAPENRKSETARDIDPNVRQRIASSPGESVWVSASAGTGKTKVLTDRVLRLLLGNDKIAAAAPHKILGLTFTKAAASEMILRISATLSRWAVQPADDSPDQKGLRRELKDLLGTEPNERDIKNARQLFARVMDCAGGLKIMTIHAFCQSVLARFPLEAGINPQFTALDEHEAKKLLQQAAAETLKTKDEPLRQAINTLGAALSESQFTTLLQNLASERDQLGALLDKNFGADGLYTKTCQVLGIPAGKTPQELLLEYCQNDNFDHDELLSACQILLSASAKGDQEKGQIIADWLSQTPQGRAANFHTYTGAFLTQKGRPHKSTITKKTGEVHPDILRIMETEAARVRLLTDQLKSCESANLTHALITLANAILERYALLKFGKGALDFDDLIFKTRALLQNSASWVLYKLDNGIDHILIDEAQDTNPEQWSIIEALSDEFFHSEMPQENPRTLFTVGDEKQSIYSFQRAAPEKFDSMRRKFATQITERQAGWHDVDLNISFRSTAAVLSAVDAVFSENALSDNSVKPLQHISFRRGQAGRVELWPLEESDAEKAPIDHWAPPITLHENQSAGSRLAEKIAGQIQTWLKTGEELPARGRPIQPGDIMILMRTRSAFVSELTKALKRKNIPVSGADRMVLSNEISVQDLLACAGFALLPSDDLTLACLLKSPLIGLSEEELFKLAAPRKEQSLWQALKNSAHKDAYSYLRHIIQAAQSLRPYDFFNRILNQPCPADPLSGLHAFKSRLGEDVWDPLQEFLSAALNFEMHNIPSLQHFLDWQSNALGDIKREMEGAQQCVRIMTVHASKGLQAPIVILPDTTRTIRRPPGQTDARLLWPDKTGLNVPLWSPRKELDHDLYVSTQGEIQTRADAEYRRLLYVAMTRAEDHLYICGHIGKKRALDDSWYFLVQNALQNHPHSESLEDGTLRINAPQTREPDRADRAQERAETTPDLPPWLLKPITEKAGTPGIITPSNLSSDAQIPAGLLRKDSEEPFLRGTLTHKLLELLPELPEKNRKAAAQNYLEKNGDTLSKDVRSDMVDEIMAILNNAEFAPLFGPGSLAEVPITGILPGGQILSGQIDRLHITETDIWIIDYKTGRKPPENEERIPAAYKKQLTAYADTITQIYPGRKIHCALLWTDGPTLMPIPYKNS